MTGEAIQFVSELHATATDPAAAPLEFKFASVEDEVVALRKQCRYVTKTVTFVVQVVQGQDDLCCPAICAALQEYIDDCAKGSAGNSGYERHIQKNGSRIDVISSVYPDPAEVARENLVSGDGDHALQERLLRIRQMARYLPGGENDNAAGRFAYTMAELAKDIRETTDEALAAIGVPKDAPDPEKQDDDDA